MSKSEIQIWLFVFFQTYGFLLYEIVMAIYIEEEEEEENYFLKIDQM